MEGWPEKLGLRAGPSMELRVVERAKSKALVLCQGRSAVELALSVVSEQGVLAEGVAQLKVGKPLV